MHLKGSSKYVSISHYSYNYRLQPDALHPEELAMYEILKSMPKDFEFDNGPAEDIIGIMCDKELTRIGFIFYRTGDNANTNLNDII